MLESCANGVVVLVYISSRELDLCHLFYFQLKSKYKIDFSETVKLKKKVLLILIALQSI